MPLTVWVLQYDDCEERRVEAVFSERQKAVAWAKEIEKQDHPENDLSLLETQSSWGDVDEHEWTITPYDVDGAK